MVATRDTGNNPPGDELLGYPVDGSTNSEDDLDAVLLEEVHSSWSHAACDDMGDTMGCEKRGEDTRLVTRALQFLTLEYYTTFDGIEVVNPAVAEMLGYS